MALLMHCADLHLASSEAEYSFSVLDEIVDRAASCDVLLLAGDIFDSHGEIERCKERFRRALEGLPPGVRVLFLPGNHEQLRAGDVALEKHDFGRAELLWQEPFSLVPLPELDCEVLAIPHQSHYGGYLNPAEWNLPAKTARHRIALAHATVPQLVAGLYSDEKTGSVLDAHLFEFFRVDYAALGHIHGHRMERVGRCLCAYPGSARVWRQGEVGRHGFILVDTERDMAAEFVPLTAAGACRELEIPLGFDGRPLEPFPFEAQGRNADTVLLRLSGFVESEHFVSEWMKECETRLSPRFRRVSFDRSGVVVFGIVATHPLARRFLEEWRAVEPPREAPEWEVWRRARLEGLAALRRVLEVVS